MPIAEVNGQKIHYQDTGGDGPVVVFSHGLFMSGEMFEPQVEALRGDYRCITWDERGHGRTGDATADFSYYDSAEDLYQLMRSLGIDHAVFLGMSQGGYLSQRLALTHPEVVDRLVLLSTQAAPEEPEKIQAYDELVGTWQKEGLTEQIATTVSTIILDPAYPVTAPWVERWKSITPENLGHVYRTLASRDDVTDRLHEIQVPTLVLWGEQDLAIAEERARTLADRIPDARLVAFPDAGHGVNLTHPDLVTDALREFLAA